MLITTLDSLVDRFSVPFDLAVAMQGALDDGAEIDIAVYEQGVAADVFFYNLKRLSTNALIRTAKAFKMKFRVPTANRPNQVMIQVNKR